MKLESEFVIEAPGTQVFDKFLDPDVLGPCIPGCESLQRIDDTHYTGVIANEVAHVKFRAAFSVEIIEMARPTQVIAVMSGEDNRLASSLKVDATLNIASRDDGSSDIRYEMTVVLWGKLGRMGEAIIRRKTVDIEREFVKRFTAACTAAKEPALAVAPEESELVRASAPPRAVPTPATTSSGGPSSGAMAGSPPAAASSGATDSQPATRNSHSMHSTSGRPEAAGGRVSWWRRLTGWISKKWSKK